MASAYSFRLNDPQGFSPEQAKNGRGNEFVARSPWDVIILPEAQTVIRTCVEVFSWKNDNPIVCKCTAFDGAISSHIVIPPDSPTEIRITVKNTDPKHPLCIRAGQKIGTILVSLQQQRQQ